MLLRNFGWPDQGWNPWEELRRLQNDMDRLFSDITEPSARDFPAVNIWTSENDARVTCELPGVDPKDLDISVSGDTLTLKGTRKPEEFEPGKEVRYHRKEREFGQFTRTFELPFEVNPEAVSASCKNGELVLTLPRAEADKPRKIAVKSA